MATQTLSATQTNLIAKLGEVASISDDLHKGNIHGTIQTWVPVQEEDIRVYMLERLADVAIACSQAQQIVLWMIKEELPKFLLVTGNEGDSDLQELAKGLPIARRGT